MQRIFTSLLFVGLMTIAFQAKAQLADGTIAPNWTATDIDGNTHTLYEYLDAGYAVILDFSATWCGPCWSYHSSGALEDFYHDYGPNGTVEAGRGMVFFIEGDPSTTLADLNGTGGNTQGNWVSGTEYPIIDAASIANDYEIGYFPTIYKVCPNRIVTEIGAQAYAGLVNEMNADNCTPAFQATDALLLQSTGSTIICDQAATFSVEFMNFGLEPLTNASFEVKNVFNQTLASAEWEGNLETYQTEIVEISTINDLLSDEFDLVVTVENDGEEDNNTIELELDKVPDDAPIFASSTGTVTIGFALQTDDWGGETSWELTNSTGQLLYSGSNLNSDQLYEANLVVPANDCYNFQIFDTYGDGICCAFGEGFYRLTDESGEVLIEGGQFGSVESSPFRTEGVSNVNDPLFVSTLAVFPNPVQNQFDIRFGLQEAGNLDISVYNAYGQAVRSVATGRFAAGEHTLNVNAQDLSEGVYFVRFQDGESQITRKFVVQR